MANVQLSISLDSSLASKLEAMAATERRTRSNMVSTLLSEALAVRNEELPSARTAATENAA